MWYIRIRTHLIKCNIIVCYLRIQNVVLSYPYPSQNGNTFNRSISFISIKEMRFNNQIASKNTEIDELQWNEELYFKKTISGLMRNYLEQ